ncbi:MAG: universal stress protein [Deltaproteobacteria bacterium]|nr:MAG: universal stress protein [Deltaproteobacteria bacterium]
MRNRLLHIFRNTPFGRETLMQSVYFCKVTNTPLKVYVPRFRQFLMYFQNTVVTVDLDEAFLRSPGTAKSHAEGIIRPAGLVPQFIEPKGFTASTLPDLPVDISYMCCPRSISDLSTKIGLGYIGPRVRAIIKNADFPVLIPTPVYKEWRSITVFFGGSSNAVGAFRLALHIGGLSGYPVRIFTQGEGKPRRHYEEILEKEGLADGISKGGIEWIFFDGGKFRENLFEVPHDSLVVVGAYGHGLIKELVFGSMMEEVQTTLPNNMMIVGPNYAAP